MVSFFLEFGTETKNIKTSKKRKTLRKCRKKPCYKRWRYLFLQKKDDVWRQVFQIFFGETGCPNPNVQRSNPSISNKRSNPPWSLKSSHTQKNCVFSTKNSPEKCTKQFFPKLDMIKCYSTHLRVQIFLPKQLFPKKFAQKPLFPQNIYKLNQQKSEPPKGIIYVYIYIPHQNQDSLTLLHVLLELQRRSPVKFTVSAATVNPETPEFSPEPLIVPWIFSLSTGASTSWES